MALERDQQQVKSDIEFARGQLAGAVDQLVDRLAPSRLIAEAQASAKQQVNSPRGQAVVAGVAVLVLVILIRNLRHSRR